MGQLTEIGLRATNLLNYTTWTVGTTGSQSGFGDNGAVAENHIVERADPQGKMVPVWEARPDTTSGADGGWNSSLHSIDRNAFYRFSVWVMRTVKGNGHFYMGLKGYDSSSTHVGVYRRSNGDNDTNPYFTVNSQWNEWGDTNQWYLAVGHVWPEGSGTGSNHIESGIYNTAGELIYTADLSDFVWRPDNTQALHRAYLYYSTVTTRQQFVYPRIDKLDGTEPTVQDLIHGYDSAVYDELLKYHNGEHKAYSVSNSGITLNRVSEIGVSDGLIMYYPLDRNLDEYTGLGTPLNAPNGATIVAGRLGQAYEFNGFDQYLTGAKPSESVSGTKAATASIWFKTYDTTADNRPFMYGSYELLLYLNSQVFRWYVNNGSTVVNILSTTTIQSDTWYHVCGTYDGANTRIYINGQLENSGSQSGDIRTNGGNVLVGALGAASYNVNNVVDEVRLYKRALSPEEVYTLYDIGKVKIGKNVTYAQEVREA